MRNARSFTLLCAALSLLTACSTSPKPNPDLDIVLESPPLDSTETFRPATPDSAIHLKEGRYPNLFSPDSYAVWVNEDVIALKRAQAVEAGEEVDDQMDVTLALVDANYIVFECHVESAFPDSSIAYDMVGLRNVDVYLETPDGSRVRPIQRILGGTATDEPVDALTKFGRTNILVFAKRDILIRQPAIMPNAEGVRLVFAGFNSAFYFEWTAAPVILPEGEKPDSWRSKPSEIYQAGKVRFSELYQRLRVLAHMFD